MHTKKVVLLHDWLTGFRGGERVLEALCEIYPEAPIYTLIHKKGSTSLTIESKEINTSWLNYIPGIHENYRFYLPLMPFAAMSLKIPSDTEIMISSSHCVIKGVPRPPGCIHISYIHSPMRYIYDQFENYFGKSKFSIKFLATLIRPFLRTWDYIVNDSIDLLIANSSFVQKRISSFYNRNSLIIHPFVDLQDFNTIGSSTITKKSFFVMVTAFAPNKKVDLAIKAFNDLNYELRIIGSGSKQEEQYLRSLAKPNVKFLGQLSRTDLITALSEAKALIFPGIEDFGIVPLESLAAGTPIIAYRGGGVLDTLDSESAVFFTDPSVNSLKLAVLEFHECNFKSETLRKKAENFSKEKFKKRLCEATKNISISNRFITSRKCNESNSN